MRTRALIPLLAKALAAVAVVATGLGGCAGPHKNKIMADTPALPYEVPDVDEITGIDPDDEPVEYTPMTVPAATPATPAPAPAAAPAAAAPATPAKPAAKPAAKAAAPKPTK